MGENDYTSTIGVHSGAEVFFFHPRFFHHPLSQEGEREEWEKGWNDRVFHRSVCRELDGDLLTPSPFSLCSVTRAGKKEGSVGRESERVWKRPIPPGAGLVAEGGKALKSCYQRENEPRPLDGFTSQRKRADSE